MIFSSYTILYESRDHIDFLELKTTYPHQLFYNSVHNKCIEHNKVYQKCY